MSQETAEFRSLLLKRQKALLSTAEQGENSAETVELDQTKVGRLSRMDALQSQAMAKATNQRRDMELRRIAAALRRLDEGEYGDCLGCGEPIAPQRLQADPAAPLCIQCAGKAELSA
jgi:DnaK suppressor protein